MKQVKKSVLKRIAAGVMAFVLLILCGCGSKSAGNQNAKTKEGNQPSATVIFYGAGGGNLQWDMKDSVLWGMLGMYKTTGINFVAVLGGQNQWPEGYFADLLNTTDEETSNRTGWFYINVNAVNEKFDELAKEFGIDPLEFEAKICSKEGGDGLKERLDQEMFCEKFLPQVEGTKATVEYPIEKENTLERTLNIVKKQFPADHYIICFSGHGTGSADGVCSVEKYKDNEDYCLTIPSIDEACRNAGFGDKLKFDLMAFDACCMGGIELGVRLSNYYKYMFGSEVTQTGGLNQRVIVRSIADNWKDENLAYWIAHNVCERKYKDMNENQEVQTGAIFLGANANGAAAAIDKAATELLNATYQDEYLKTEIYDALKKAMIYSYSIYNSPDARDLFINLSSILNGKGITQFNEAIQGAISGINNFMVENWYVFGGRPIYYSHDGGIIQGSENYKEKYLNHDLCGGNICLINYTNFTNAYSADSVEDFFGERDYKLGEFDESYYMRYKDFGFENYAQLMMDCAEYFYQEDFYYEKQNLAVDLADPAGADYQDITNIHWSDDRKAIQMDILNYGYETAADSSGDSVIDFFDTTASHQVFLTRKMPVTRQSDGKKIDLDYIIGTRNLPREGTDASRREFNFFVSDLMATPIRYVNNMYANEDVTMDIVTPWEKNADEQCRIEVLKAVLPSEKEAEDNAFKYEIYEGWCKINGAKKSALHIYRSDEENIYRYAKSVLVESVNGQDRYTPVENAEAIKFKHYYLIDDIDSQSEASDYTENLWYPENEYQIGYDESMYYNNNIYWVSDDETNQTLIYVNDDGSEKGKSMGFFNTGCLDEDFFSIYDDDMYWYPSDMLDELDIYVWEMFSVDNDPQKCGYYFTTDPILSGNSLVMFNKNGDALLGSSYDQLPVYGKV